MSVCVRPCCSPAVVVVRGAGSSPPAASPEEPAERTAGKSPHAAQHEQHEARPHPQVSRATVKPPVERQYERESLTDRTSEIFKPEIMYL